MVGGADLVAQEDRGAAHSLLDDPAALGHAGNELQHVVPLAVGGGVMHITFHKPVACRQPSACSQHSTGLLL